MQQTLLGWRSFVQNNLAWFCWRLRETSLCAKGLGEVKIPRRRGEQRRKCGECRGHSLIQRASLAFRLCMARKAEAALGVALPKQWDKHSKDMEVLERVQRWAKGGEKKTRPGKLSRAESWSCWFPTP